MCEFGIPTCRQPSGTRASLHANRAQLPCDSAPDRWLTDVGEEYSPPLRVLERILHCHPHAEISGGRARCPIRNRSAVKINRRHMVMNKRRILVVDDESSITQIVKMVLDRNGGFMVETLNRSARALEVARAFKPDLIMTDLLMPEVPGDQLIRDLRTDSALCRVPVLMFTSTATREEVMARDQGLGDVPFLPKPSNAEVMMEAIEQTLAF